MSLIAVLVDSADDLDRLEELEPMSGRVGRANRIRGMATTCAHNTLGVRFLCECGCGTSARLTIDGGSVFGSIEVGEDT